jgi:hypothetical protein
VLDYGLDRGAARDLAGGGASHAVGDHHQLAVAILLGRIGRRPDREGVFVVLASQTDVGGGGDSKHRVSRARCAGPKP